MRRVTCAESNAWYDHDYDDYIDIKNRLMLIAILMLMMCVVFMLVSGCPGVCSQVGCLGTLVSVAMSVFWCQGVKISGFSARCPNALRVDKGPDRLAREGI